MRPVCCAQASGAPSPQVSSSASHKIVFGKAVSLMFDLLLIVQNGKLDGSPFVARLPARRNSIVKKWLYLHALQSAAARSPACRECRKSGKAQTHPGLTD